jgi:type IV pilus assembly protein PilP
MMRTIAGIFALLVLTVPWYACTQEKPVAKQQQAQKVQPAQSEKKTEVQPSKPEEKKVEIETYAYNPQGKRDPFLSIIEASKKDRDTEKKKKSMKPQESYDAPDVKIVAIARDKNKYYAMIQLPDKKYFTIKEGMTVGLYGGKVIKIDAGSVVIREYLKNYKGEMQPKDIILKLRKEEGE